MTEDLYFKKLVTYRICRHELRFRVSQELFSSHQVDLGTQFLLRHIAPACSLKYKKVLDQGCGYGAIGLTLKTISPETEVHMVDSDALAVSYARQNGELNGLDLKIYSSLDYENVTDTDFDLIISNIPGKAGPPVIEHLLKQARYYLAAPGEMAIVVVKPLEETCEEIFRRDAGINLIEKKSRSGHVIFHYRFKSPPTERHAQRGTLDADPYFRGSAQFNAGNITYTAETAYGLPEFESYSYATELLLDGLGGLRNRPVRRALVYNPQTGHLPVAIWKFFKPEATLLCDRDLLALRYSSRNLQRQGCPAEQITTIHGVGITGVSGEHELAVGVLREERPAADANVVRGLADVISPGGIILLAASSTAITRVLDKLPAGLTVRERKKYRGYSMIVLAK